MSIDITDDPLTELLQTAEVVEYKHVSQQLKTDCVAQVRQFIINYIKGNFTGGALGKVKELDRDEIVLYLVDMLHYNNKWLTVEAMNMLQCHFNQFARVIDTMQECLILDEQEEEDTFNHIKYLNHRFFLLIDSVKLTEEESALNEIIECFKTPRDVMVRPALIEINYAQFWGTKCKGCCRWYRVRSTERQAKMVRRESSKVSAECLEKDFDRAADVSSQQRINLNRETAQVCYTFQ